MSKSGSIEDSVVFWDKACRRFQDRLGLNPCHLEALLILCSQAYRNRKFPTLGLRVHVFGQSEPRVFWNFHGTRIYDEQRLKEVGEGVADYISCTKCGHSAWAGVFVKDRGVSGEQGRLTNLPVFYENAELEGGQELVILHDPNSVAAEVLERKGWDYEVFSLDPDNPQCEVRRHFKKTTVKAPEKEFWRVVRTGDKGEVSDTRSCPACGSTAGEHQRPLMLTPRSGVATNISVYGASLMTGIDIPEERRLLVFSDNRQETSFLAGFLSDRHRRFNVRRAVASFLKEAGADSSWKLLAKIDEDEDAPGHRYDLAARILLSVNEGRFWGRDKLPRKGFKVPKSLLQDLIPRDLLEVDFIDQMDPSQKENNEYKQWLLDNISFAEAGKDTKEVFESVELFKSERGQWCLRMFNEVLLIELSSMIAREGSLQSLGLSTWRISGFEDAESFDRYASEHPELKLNGDGLRYLGQWFLDRCAELGQWRGLDDSSRRHALGKKKQHKPATLEDLISKGLDKSKPISKNSKIARIIYELAGGDGDVERSRAALQVWSKSKTWVEFIADGPLEPFVSISEDLVPKIKTTKIAMVNNPRIYRGTMSGQLVAVSGDIDLKGMPTGKKGDTWEQVELPEHPYYAALYQRSFGEEFRLVRANEHNGMIAGKQAAQVIEDFKNQKINALVATPTLEMGVDLPDLPVVIHRSVPPDPSNYAQRAGRAGRDPKRALVVTHCGFGSHDLTFYSHPDQMVSGEILPPGLPNENVSILQKQVQGLILSLLALKAPEFKRSLHFSWWGDLVDLSELKRRYLEIVTDSDREGLPDVERPINWEEILAERKEFIDQRVHAFSQILDRALWHGMDSARREDLHRRIKLYGSVENWRIEFQKQLERYLMRAKLHMDDFEKMKFRPRSAARQKESEIARQFARANKLARMFISNDVNNYPLSYLSANGFMPNFDFPGKVVRFVGVLPSYQDKTRQSVQQKDRYLAYTRSASVALREFAPEQNIYGQGFIYKVDRYVAEGIDEQDGKAWGICQSGCTQLTPPGKSVCQFCESDLIRSEEEAAGQPKLVEVQEVHGMQVSVISDQQSKREFNPVVREVRHLGIPETPSNYRLRSSPQFGWQLYQGIDEQIRNVTFLKGKGRETEDGPRIDPLYKEVSDGESRVFGVRARVPAREAQNWEAFIPAVFAKSQGLRLSIPYNEAKQQNWIVDYGADEHNLAAYFKTFAALMERASVRVLRLNKRKGSLTYLDEEIRCSLGDGTTGAKERHLLILDNEEGGSGIIELMWNYWDAIMEEAGRLVLQDCCNSSCYRCLKSYDNQRDHDFLDKAIFAVDSQEGTSAPLFENFRRYLEGQANYVRADASNANAVDAKSSAETKLELYLQENYPLGRRTQTQVISLAGKEVSRPDFELETFDGDEVTVYVDGYRFHGDPVSMLGDCEKRNHLTKQGRRTLSLPGVLLVPKLQTPILESILRPLISKIRFDIPRSGATIEHLPQKWLVRPETVDFIHKGVAGLKSDKWEAIELGKLFDSIRGGFPGVSVKCEEIKSLMSSLLVEDLPIGFQQGMLLTPVHGAQLTSSENQKRWTAVLVSVRPELKTA